MKNDTHTFSCNKLPGERLCNGLHSPAAVSALYDAVLPGSSLTGLLRKGLVLLSLLAFAGAAVPAAEVRLKDIGKVDVGQESQLIGYGLIVGLDGTGDQGKAVFTVQSITNMLQKMGVTVPADKIKVKNVAAVMVTATVSPFSKSGSRLDVAVSSLGDAKSLKGGTLLLTPLKGVDGQVYAVAQGPVSVDSVKTRTMQENYLTSGRVYGGALLYNQVQVADWVREDNGRKFFYVTLNKPDFTTSGRIAEAINREFDGSAKALDPGVVQVIVPRSYYTSVVEFASKVEGVSLEPDAVAKVIINERTGTVVVGENVSITAVAVSNNGLNLEVGKKSKGGATKGRSSAVINGTTVNELVATLNALGVTPKDIIDIFQAIKKAGAIQAEIEVM